MKKGDKKGDSASTLSTNTALRETNYLCYRLLLGQPEFGDAAMHLRRCFLNEPNLLPQSSSSDVIPLEDIDDIYRNLPNDFLLTIIKAGYESLCNSHPEIQTGSLLLPDIVNRLLTPVTDSNVDDQPSQSVPPSYSLNANPVARLLGQRQHQRLRRGIVGTEFFCRMAPRRHLAIHRGQIPCLINDRSGKCFITAAMDGIIKIWDRSTLRLLYSIVAYPAKLSPSDCIRCIDVSLDNRILVSAGQNMLKFWNLSNGNLMHTIPAVVEKVMFSNVVTDERRWIIYVCRDGSVWSCTYHWDDMANIPALFDDPTVISADYLVQTTKNERPPLVQSSNGTFVATGYVDGTIHVYTFDAQTRMFVFSNELKNFHTTKIRFITFHGKGPGLVCGSDDSVTKFDVYPGESFNLTRKIEIIFDTADRKRRPHLAGGVLCFGGEKLAAIVGSNLVFFNLADGQADYVESLSLRNRWHSIEPCPANRDVLALAGDDGTLQLHCASSGRLLKSFSVPRLDVPYPFVPRRAIFKTAFSMCGSNLVAVDGRGQLLALSLIPRAMYENDCKIPYQYFFHWEMSHIDFDNLARPIYANVPTQIPMENVPPPYIVDADGHVHSSEVQKLVPGRETFSNEIDLMPTQSSHENVTGTMIIDDAFFTEDEFVYPDMMVLKNQSKHYLVEPWWRCGRSICDPVDVHIDYEPMAEWERFAADHGADQGTNDFFRRRTHVRQHGHAVALVVRDTGGGDEPEHPLADYDAPRGSTFSSNWRRRRNGLRQNPRTTLRYDAFPLPSAVMSQEVPDPISDYDEERDPDWSNPALERLKARSGENSSDEGKFEPGPLPPRRDGRPRRNASYRRRVIADCRARAWRKRRRRWRTVKEEGEEEEEEEEEFSREVTTDDSQMADEASMDSVELPEKEEDETSVEETADSQMADEEVASSAFNEEEKEEAVVESKEEEEKEEEEEGDEEVEEEEEEEDAEIAKKVDELTEDDSKSSSESEPDADSDSDSDYVASRPPPAARRRFTARRRPPSLRRKRKSSEDVEKENKEVRKRRKVADKVKKENEVLEMEPFRYEYPPLWMTDALPWPNRTAPQKGEVIVYHRVGHVDYLNKVNDSERDEHGEPLHGADVLHSKHFVVDAVYRILETGERVCDVYLKPVKEENEENSVDVEDVEDLDNYKSVRYEDMDGVLSYLTPERLFDDAMSVEWEVGDRCRAIIDDHWWYGKVIGIDDKAMKESDYWLCLKVRWTSGDEEAISPWDLFPVAEGDSPLDTVTKDVQAEELPTMLPRSWWASDGIEEKARQVVKAVSQMPESAEFILPVDLELFPVYPALVTYPMDLSTIEMRLEHQFYRSRDALINDCRLLGINAAIFNKEGSDIVHRARFISTVLERVLKSYDFELKDVEKEVECARSVLRENREANMKKVGRKRKPVNQEESDFGRRTTRRLTGHLPVRREESRRKSNGRYPSRPVRCKTRVNYTDFLSDQEFEDEDAASMEEYYRPQSRSARRCSSKRSLM